MKVFGKHRNSRKLLSLLSQYISTGNDQQMNQRRLNYVCLNLHFLAWGLLLSLDIVGYRRMSWDIVGYHRISSDIVGGYRWISLDLVGYRRISSDIVGYRRKSLDIVAYCWIAFLIMSLHLLVAYWLDYWLKFIDLINTLEELLISFSVT